MAKELSLSIEEREFLKERSYDLATISVGYLSGLDTPTHNKYAGLMRQIDPDYSPTPWCDNCVYQMAKKVWEKFGPIMDIAPPAEIVTDPPPPPTGSTKTRNRRGGK